MPTRSIRSTGIGAFGFGSTAFSGSVPRSIITPSPAAKETNKLYTNAIGFETLGRRILAKSEFFTIQLSNAALSDVASIQISSASGVLLGLLRTDIEFPIIKSFSFQLDSNGCGDGELVLTSLPTFPILPFSVVSINIGDTSFDWYRGSVRVSPEPGTTDKPEYIFVLEGLRKQLNSIRSDRDFAAPQDIGEIVQDILINDIVPYSKNITSNAAKLETTTGVLTASTLETSKAPLTKVLETLANMANCNWGVDGDGDFFFLPIDPDPLEIFAVGYQIYQFSPSIDLDNIRNSIIVKRQQGRGSGGAGWAVAVVKNDDISQAKYGLKELEYQVPGFFSDPDCDIIGDAILAEKKDPQFTATSDGHLIKSASDYIGIGTYRFIAPLAEYDVNTSADESISGWSKTGSGDTDISSETVIIMDGLGALKFTYTNGTNDVYQKTINITGNNSRIRFYYQSNRTGLVFTVGIGEVTWNEFTKTQYINVPNVYTFFDWDISSFDIDVNKIGIRIDDTNTGIVNKALYIDRIIVMQNDFKHYDLRATKINYNFDSSRTSANVQFGAIPKMMEHYIQSLFEQAQESKFNGEVR